MSDKNIIDEKNRIRELATKIDVAMAKNDYELAYTLFKLLAKHFGYLMPLTGE